MSKNTATDRVANSCHRNNARNVTSHLKTHQTSDIDKWHVTSRNPVTGKKPVFTKWLPVLLKIHFNITKFNPFSFHLFCFLSFITSFPSVSSVPFLHSFPSFHSFPFRPFHYFPFLPSLFLSSLIIPFLSLLSLFPFLPPLLFPSLSSFFFSSGDIDVVDVATHCIAFLMTILVTFPRGHHH